MSTNRKASMAKRARELAQKDGVKDREARRAERKQRALDRAASGIVGPEIDYSTPADGVPGDSDSDVDADGGGGGGGGGGTGENGGEGQPLPDSAEG